MEILTYDEFINNILETRGRFNCGDEYHERHHIKPKCMGGTNDDENLIDLFAREHFEVHRLLAKENPENASLVYAWVMMAWVKNENQERYQLTPEEYEEIKRKRNKMFSGENHPMYGVHRSGENSPNYGKHHSKESREKISKSHKGKQQSEETKEKIRKSINSRFENEENRLKCGRHRYGEDAPFFGKHHSASTRETISKKNKGGNNGRATMVICLETNKIYRSVSIASEETNISENTIRHCCFGRTKTAGGFKWKFVYDNVRRDNSVILGAITLGLITEKEVQEISNKQSDLRGKYDEKNTEG